MADSLKKYSNRPNTLEFLYSYTNSTGDIIFEGIVEFSEDGIPFFKNYEGLGGVGPIPTVGDTITFKVKKINLDPFVEDFSDSKNNGIYVLVTDNEVIDPSFVIENGVAITFTSSVVSGETILTGTYTFLNPDDYSYLYFVFDFKNKTEVGLPVVLSGNKRYFKVDWILDGKNGVAKIDYTFTKPSCLFVYKDGNLITSTGYVGLNETQYGNLLLNAGVKQEDIGLVYPLDGSIDNGTGQLRIKTSDILSYDLFVDSPIVGAVDTLTPVATSLSLFYMDNTEFTEEFVCEGSKADTIYYHNGSSSLPEIGDIIYSDINGANLVAGTSFFRCINLTAQAFPPGPGGTGTFVQVNSVGQLISKGNICTCSETLRPVITQGDIDLVSGANVNINVEVTHNPFAWQVITTCVLWTLEGGAKGAIFSYTDCSGIAKRVAVSVSQSTTVDATVSPILVSGTGVITSNGSFVNGVIPEGLTFSGGIISGRPNKVGTYPITLKATNCVGNSANVTFDIIVASNEKLTPFEMDRLTFESTNTNACAIIAPNLELFYHNGESSYPVKGDTIYGDCKGISTFIGGDKWYRMDVNVIQVSTEGIVIDTYTC